ncbi:cytochrome c biogenesis protein ResB [Actinomycetospora sp. TBRC 11914]|uniref:cytochrome c biogenesis protein ResB n=1 Tax=Actinomycetospora sp. TBRC 11914 TaxID=2729387 RepID=UPI00145E5DAA|nr:cytochrome c biogenesis protein ResB [Actinomycetospora sp. TBRC 11914]NMO91867.1 cytochrome c biogenesis protein ResB [Actinomycetospora sp. TBRC 11914]
MTQTLRTPPDEAPEPPAPRRWGRDLLALARNTWRGLTSMRTALILLFLLALAALPGAFIPQRGPSPQAVQDYFAAHPTLAPLLDKIGIFDLFATPWFSAVYLLLFISLVGCLVPRTWEQIRGLRARTVAVPRNLSRLPHHAAGTDDRDPDEVLSAARRRLRGWKVDVREEPGGVRTISAEKGALREVGNVVFHMSLLALLVGIAVGKLFGYEGDVIVMADGSEFCNSGILAYDTFRPGLRVDGTNLDPFCLDVDRFDAQYRPDGAPQSFEASVRYSDAQQIRTGAAPTPATIQVNDPLRFDGERVYLLDHGYAPQFTVTFPDGEQRTQAIQWEPVDPSTFLSQGATKFDRPSVTTDAERRRTQLAITGLFAPTSSGGGVVTSTYPALTNPEVAADVYRGDLGLDSGKGQSIFGIDQSMVDQGRLVRVARQNLTPGQTITLDDGTRVRFDDVKQWVRLQVSHDPAQDAVLVAAIALLVGITLSLTIKRRRFWVRVTPGPRSPSTTDGRTVSGGEGSSVELGGLARTDQAGYGEEFDRLRTDLLGAGRRQTPTRQDAPGDHGGTG